LDTSGLKNQLVERLEAALGEGGEGGSADELEDVPDVEVDAADAAKLAELEKKSPVKAKAAANGGKENAVAAASTDAKETPKPKPTKEERKAQFEKEKAERKAAAEKAKKEADEEFVKELVRKKERAEKFNLPFMLSEQEKQRVRNVGAEKKFGLDAKTGEAKPAEKTAEQKKKEKEEFEAKLKARAERFGAALKPLPKAAPIYQPMKRPGQDLPLPVAKK